MQSTSLLKRILAMALCLALAVSYLPGINLFASAAETTATDATEAASDLLSANLGHNVAHWDNYSGDNTGLTAEKNSVCVNGSASLESWEFKATAVANLKPTAQIHLTKEVDFSNHYLVMDVKYVTSGPEESTTFSTRLHAPNWDNLNVAQSATVKAGEWQTVSLLPSAAGMLDGKDVSELSSCKLVTFAFNFADNTGAERAIYIDNLRAVKIETAKEDWIKLPIDGGMSNCEYEVVTGLTVDSSSSQSLKLYTTTESGVICFHTQHAVEGKDADPVLDVNQRLDNYPNMTTGILSGWFYFGESAPSGNVTLTYSDWGTSNTVDFAFEAKGNGWYYGTLDCDAFTTTTGSEGSTSAVWRVQIANLPKASTMYIDCLTFSQKAIDGLSIAYPYNSETYQQNAAPANRFNALTFNSARYEVESAQMILTPSFDVENFELVIGNLVNDNGNVISGTDFDVFIQHYVTAEGSKNGGTQATNPETGEVVWNAEDHLTDGVNGVFPNALIPQAAYIAKGENVIAAGNNQGIWVNLNVGSAAPGTYTGFATLIVNGSNMQIPVSVTVYDVALPEEVHVESSFQIWWDLLEAGEGSISASMARAYEAYLISKRIMPMDAWNITRYDDTFVNYAVNWAQDPKISSYALKYGKTADGLLDTDGLTATLTAVINKNLELAAAGSDVDLFAKAYCYFGQICDEPRNDEDYAVVNDCTAKLEAIKNELAPMLADYPALQESFMNLKHLVTGPDPADKTYAFLDAQDYGSTALTGESYIYVPQYQWLNTEEQRALYADEEEIWWYGCNHPVNPYPSYSFNSPLITSRALGWMMYDYDIDGILYWCVNSWGSYGENGIELKDYWGTYTSATPGEGILILPGVDYGVTGPIGTIRIENIRESHEEYEYLWLLEQFTGSDAAAATYTAGMYEGSIPSTDVTIHHNNRIALLQELENLNVAANGATVIEPDLPIMPTDPQPEPEVIKYPVDIIAVGTCAEATEQTDVVNGEDTAWQITYTSVNDWVYPSIELDKTYDISNHMLVMDVKVTGMDECRMQLATINDNWGAASASTYLTNLEGWNSLSFDLSANGASLTEMSKFSLGFDVPADTNYAIYIDNIYLVPLETVANDWIHMYQDTGSSYKNATTSFSVAMLKAENSGLSLKVVAPADAKGKFTFNTEQAAVIGEIAAKPDFTTGTLGAWFYFGDAEPDVTVTVTSSNWKGSTAAAMNFVYGGEGWYYGTLDTSTITFSEEANLVDIIRLTFNVPAGYNGYVDGITFPVVENVEGIVREDLSADWTNLSVESNAETAIVEDFCYAEGSSQALKIDNENEESYLTFDVSAIAPDMTEGTLGAWFYFGDAAPSATLSVIDDEDYDSSMHIDGPISFTFGENVDGWYYGTVDVANIVFDEGDVDAGASADAIAYICITLPAGSYYMDCLTLEGNGEVEPDPSEPTEPEETEPADPNDLFANALAADTVGILGGGNYTYDSASAVVCGDSSTKSWMFGGNASATGWPTALINLGKGYDMSGKVLAFNVKTEGGRGYIALSTLHEAGSWANVCTKDQFNASVSFNTSDWATVYFNLNDILAEGKSLSNIQFVKLGFDFDTNTGVERKYYIDNVRLLDNYETVENDWIHMAIDSGDSTASYIKDMDHVKAENSSLSMKVVSGDAESTWVLSPQAEYGAGIDLSNGILSGYFYFGDVEPSVKIRLTDASWNGGATMALSMTDVGDGWYYGSIDVSTIYFYDDQIANGATAEDIIRIKFTFPANSTVYVDGLTLAPVLEGDDLLKDATIACGTLQSEVTNGSDVAWKLVPELGTEHNWAYPGIILNQEYAISANYKLVMDVMPVNMTSFSFNLSSINGEFLSGVSSQYLNIGQWTTLTFDLTGNALSKFGLGMEINGGENYAVYIDNVKLVRVETVDEDLLNISVDVGESTADTYEKVDSFTKDDNSVLAMLLKPTADTGAKVSLNLSAVLGDNYDMSSGVLGAWFYFGDQTPSASVNFSGNWSASIDQAFSFGTGVDGWYYGKVDLSATKFYEEKGTMTDVERIRLYIPAGYEPVYVDYLTYNANGGTIASENDMLYNAQFAYNAANWTEANGTSYGKEYYETNGSFQSWAFKANASASLSPVAQMALSQSYDATGKILMFDVKANVATDVKVRFHNTGWADVTTDKIIGVQAGDWVTYQFDPSALVVEGKDLSDVKLITFTFNFVANTGVEREIYIDNVRLVAPETAEQDWINLKVDTGDYYTNSELLITDEKVKAEGSSLSLKATSPVDVENGKFTFYIADLDMSNGTLGAWFYFGDAEPKARVQFTSANWKGSASASFVFGEGEDGWYYGTLDTSAVTFYDENSDGEPDDDLSAVIRLTILFAGDSTIYVDGLNYVSAACSHANTTTTTVDATCTETGSITVTCDDCGEVISTEELPVKDHSYESVVTPPTTEAQGYTTHTCTVCGDSYVDSYVDPIVLPSGNAALKISGATLTLQADLKVAFAVKPDVLEAYSNVYFKFKLDGKEVIISDSYYNTANGRQMYTLPGVAPRMMNDVIEIEMYGTYEGVEYVYTNTYTVMTYCNSQLGKVTEATKLTTLIVDLMNFGTMQQIYNNYKTDALINASLTEAQKAWGRNVNGDQTFTSVFGQSGVTGTASFRGASLTLSDAVVVNYVVQTDDLTGITLKITVDGEETIIGSEAFVLAEGYTNRYEIKYTGLRARQMRSTITAVVLRDGVETSKTAIYSVESYAAGVASGTNLYNLCQAMMHYGDAAIAYFNS